MSLNEQLKEINEQFLKTAPAGVLNIFQKASERLAKEKIERKALKIGDKMPAFTLKNAVGATINSGDLLEEGPLVICFYRGGW